MGRGKVAKGRGKIGEGKEIHADPNPQHWVPAPELRSRSVSDRLRVFYSMKCGTECQHNAVRCTLRCSTYNQSPLRKPFNQ